MCEYATLENYTFLTFVVPEHYDAGIQCLRGSQRRPKMQNWTTFSNNLQNTPSQPPDASQDAPYRTGTRRKPVLNNLPDDFFSAPCQGCVGNLGRNTFIGPGYWAADTSIFKIFHVLDRYQLQFRAEAFNIFNHINFQLGGTTGPAEGNNLENPQFGLAGGTSNPRNLQLGLKLISF
jgi:hypothetical protein